MRLLQFAISLLLPFAGLTQNSPAQQPNVLFISIDDLRPDLGCYGNEFVHSPNLDSLAGNAVLFNRHYVTVPTCGASRLSLLRGTLPRTRAELSNEAAVKLLSGQQEAEEPETFIHHLRRNGYYTVGIGKISHSPDGYVYPYTASKSTQPELPHSWDEMLLDPGTWETGWNAFFGYADGSNRQSKQGEVKPYEQGEVDDRGYPDGLSAELAVSKLKELAGKDQPFFLGVGFFKPHLPFTAPRKYWDLYEESALPLTPSPDIPENVHPASLHNSGEFNNYKLGEEMGSLDQPLSDAYSRKLVHAYYACISYIDAQVGKVLATLKQTGLDKNTIVIIWSDHGWHLGDHRVWGKHTLFERALRSVLMVKTPDMSEGKVCDQVVSTVDIYPTLMELCGLKMPYQADGESVTGLLHAPNDPSRRNTAYSYFRNGISMAAGPYRFTKYFREEKPVVELYDHEKDPYENHATGVTGARPGLVEKLEKQWQKGNTGVYSKPNVLFIAVDDLNDWVGCMGGHPQTRTPNIDRLAERGILFTNAHCQAPICGPSRASLMTGLYPSTSGNYLQLNDQNIKKSNEAAQKAVFLPDYFERSGYRTLGVGKLFHNGDGAQVFDEYGGMFERYGPKPGKRFKYDPAWFGKPGNTQTDWGAFPESDSLMPDYKSAAWAVRQLKKKHSAPFFLAVGFVRPHVPWYVPQKWFDKFPAEEMETPPYLPADLDDVPEMGKRVAAAPMMPTTERLKETNQWKEVIQAYLASVHFVDAQIGKVLDALDESEYAGNTIVVLWSDHGYHLGEKNRFAKQSLWERDTKTVLIYSLPEGKRNQQCNQPVQLLDTYPTLVELCGLPTNEMNEGHTLVPLLNNPRTTQWDHPAISSYGKDNVAVTGERYRLIQYEDGSMEFYDLEKDPYEWNNLAGRENYRKKIAELQSFIPEEQSDLSEYSSYDFNEYFRNMINRHEP